MRQLQEIFDVFVDNKAEEAVKSLRLFDAGKEGYDYKVNMYKLYNSIDVNEDPTILADEMGASLVKDTNYVSSFKVENDFLYLQLSEYAWQIMFDEVNDVAHTQDEKQTGDSSVIILPAVKSTEPISLTDVRAASLAHSLKRINEHMGYSTTIVGVYADHGMHIAKVIAMYNMSVGRELTSDMRWDKFSRVLHDMFTKYHEKELVNFIEASTDKSTLPTVGQFMYYEEAILGKDAVETLATMDDSDRSHPITVQFKEFSKNVLEAHEQDRELFYIRPHSMVTYHEVLDFAYKLSHNMVKHGFAEMVGHADGKEEGDISVSGMENVALLHYGRPTKLLIDLAILSPFTERDSIIIITTSGTDQLTSLLRVKDMFVNTPNVKVVEVGLVHTRQKKNYYCTDIVETLKKTFPEVKEEQLVQNLKYAVLQTQPKATRSIVNKFLMKRKHNTLQRVQDIVSKIRDEIEHQQDGVSDNVFNSTEKTIVNHLYQLRNTIRWAYTTRNPSRITSFIAKLCNLYTEYRKTFVWLEILDEGERVRKYRIAQATLHTIVKCVHLLDLKLEEK